MSGKPPPPSPTRSPIRSPSNRRSRQPEEEYAVTPPPSPSPDLPMSSPGISHWGQRKPMPKELWSSFKRGGFQFRFIPSFTEMLRSIADYDYVSYKKIVLLTDIGQWAPIWNTHHPEWAEDVYQLFDEKDKRKPREAYGYALAMLAQNLNALADLIDETHTSIQDLIAGGHLKTPINTIKDMLIADYEQIVWALEYEKREFKIGFFDKIRNVLGRS